MDIFSTTLTSCVLIYKFISSCKEFSDDAKSLAVRFEHDTKALQRVLEYFQSLVEKDPSGILTLPPDHQIVLDNCVRNLEGLLSKAITLEARIKTRKWYRVGINHVTWWVYKNELESLGNELFEWTLRFDVHTFSLPEPIKHVINVQETSPDTVPANKQMVSLLAVQQRVARIVQLGKQEQIELGKGLRIEDHQSRVQVGMPLLKTSSAMHTRAIGKLDGRPVVFEEGNSWYQDHRALASILSQADSSVGLLKCVGFYNINKEHGVETTMFLFGVPAAPSSKTNVDSLYNIIRRSRAFHNKRLVPNHSLTQRYKLARRLAVAILFIHSADWVHKAINPINILIMSDSHDDKRLQNLSRSYLYGFATARSDFMDSGHQAPGASPPGQISEVDFYIHPVRRDSGGRFTKTHDIYSLGVVLLEIGLWVPLEDHLERALQRMHLEEYRLQLKRILSHDKLRGIALDQEMKQVEEKIRAIGPEEEIDLFYWLREQVLLLLDELAANMGNTYRDVVEWCLRLDRADGDDISTSEFVKEVVDKLEDLAAIV